VAPPRASACARSTGDEPIEQVIQRQRLPKSNTWNQTEPGLLGGVGERRASRRSLPFFFESALHRSQVETGLLVTPWPLAVGIGAPIAGRLADKVSAAVLGAAGLIVLCAGLALLAGLPENPTTAEIAWHMALCGLGFGFFQAPNTSLDAVGCAAFAKRGRRRNARHRAAHGTDRRRNTRRHLVPDGRSFRDCCACRGGSIGRHRGDSQRS
jgi:hypothetical protein